MEQSKFDSVLCLTLYTHNTMNGTWPATYKVLSLMFLLFCYHYLLFFFLIQHRYRESRVSEYAFLSSASAADHSLVSANMAKV